MEESKKTTQNKASEIKSAVSNVSREFFVLFCEDNKVLENTMRNLLDLSNDEDDKRIRLDANKFLAEQLMGKPKQSTDITSGGEVVTPSLVFGNILKEGDGDVQTEV